MNIKVKNTLVATAEKCGWKVDVQKDEWEFSQVSPAGEDFSFTVDSDDVPHNAMSYAVDFDEDEHIRMWAESAGRNGVPSFRELVEDAEAISLMVEHLACELLDAVKAEGLEYEYLVMKREIQAVLRSGDAGYCTEDHDGFAVELYASYDDELSQEQAVKILQAPDPEMALLELLGDAYWEYEQQVLSEIHDKVASILTASDGPYPDGFTDSEQTMFDDLVSEMVYVNYPIDHYLKQKFCVNIMLDTGDGNTDYTLNAVYPHWDGKAGQPIDNRASIVWLAKNQGYTKTQLQKALAEGDLRDPHGFLETMRQELANLPSHMSVVVFLVQMSLGDLINLNAGIALQERNGRFYDSRKYPYCGYVILDKQTPVGLYDPWSGSGSVLEIELEKDVRLPIKFIRSALPDGADGECSIRRVYGVNETLWKEDMVKKIHLPVKIEPQPALKDAV